MLGMVQQAQLEASEILVSGRSNTLPYAIQWEFGCSRSGSNRDPGQRPLLAVPEGHQLCILVRSSPPTWGAIASSRPVPLSFSPQQPCPFYSYLAVVNVHGQLMQDLTVASHHSCTVRSGTSPPVSL